MMRPCALLLASASATPLYEIVAGSLRQAGQQHGRLAGERIRGWLAQEEMSAAVAFARQDGAGAFAALRRDNSRAFPELAEELQGIAEGAQVDLDAVWAANLLPELEGLMGQLSGEHCSDFYAVAPGGFEEAFAHGHNEDWSQAVMPYWYFLKYTAAPGADFASCAGLAYPGTLVGWAPSWNAHGIYFTQNSLWPRDARPWGLATSFVQRAALCGESGAAGFDAVLAAMARPGWSLGASLNLVSLPERRMANVEVAGDAHAALELTAGTRNYSHFNMYKRLPAGDEPQASTLHRQARADARPAPQNLSDIAALLSDTADTAYPIFRNTTLATLLLNGSTQRLDVWCCQQSAASGKPPVYSWHLPTFFDMPQTIAVAV